MSAESLLSGSLSPRSQLPRSPFRLGFMLRIPVSPTGDVRDQAALFRDALTLAIAAEDLGFDSLWLTQHHFGAVDSALPSPLVFHAAVAARTRRIRLGTTVVTASLEQPIRLAEDAATLDLLSGGRVELGLGTSSDRVERAVFGVAAEQQRERLHRHAIEIARLLGGGPVADAVADAAEARLEPRAPSLATRLWLATTTRAHACFAAEHGFGLLSSGQASLHAGDRDYVAHYADESRRHGHEPRVGLSRGLFPTRDAEEARRLLAPHAARFAERGRRLGWLPDTFTPDDFFKRDDFHFGPVDDVVERLRRDTGVPHATELLTGMLSARLTPRELMPVMERIARDVAPALGWRPATGADHHE